MKKILLITLIIANNAHGDCPLPENRSNKEYTIQAELSIKRAQSYIDANKPVAATTELTDAEDKLKDAEPFITLEIKRRMTECIEQMKTTIQIQKDYQIKTFGKLFEVN